MTLPHYANLRDCELVERDTSPALIVYIIATALAVLLGLIVWIIDPMDAVSDVHPDCQYTEGKC